MAPWRRSIVTAAPDSRGRTVPESSPTIAGAISRTRGATRTRSAELDAWVASIRYRIVSLGLTRAENAPDVLRFRAPTGDHVTPLLDEASCDDGSARATPLRRSEEP